jgi:hypothetical protein
MSTPCERCSWLEGELQRRELDMQNVELALRGERRKRINAEAKLNEQRRQSPHAHEVDEVFSYWKAKCLTPQGAVMAVLSPRREGAILAILQRGTSVQRIKQAIDAAASPAWTYNTDIEYVCRDEVNLDLLCKFSERQVPKKTRRLKLVKDEPIKELRDILVDLYGPPHASRVTGNENTTCPVCEELGCLEIAIGAISCVTCQATEQDVIQALREGTPA